MSEEEETPEITMDDVVYFMGWHIDSQRRLYDCMLTLIATLGNNETSKQLQAMHEKGQFLYPPPWAREGSRPHPDSPAKNADDTDEIYLGDTDEIDISRTRKQ